MKTLRLKDIPRADRKYLLKLFLICNSDKVFSGVYLKNTLGLTPLYFNRFLEEIREEIKIYEYRHYFSAGVNIRLELMKKRRLVEELGKISKGSKCPTLYYDVAFPVPRERPLWYPEEIYISNICLDWEKYQQKQVSLEAWL